MSKDFLNIGQSWGAERIAAIKNSYEQKKIKASGAFGESLEQSVTLDNNVLRIIIKAANHTQYMQFGREPNKNSSPEQIRKFVGWAGSTILREWVKNKRLSISPYAVAYKIATKGVTVPSQFNDGKFITENLTPETFQNLISLLGDAVLKEFKSKYIESWQTV